MGIIRYSFQNRDDKILEFVRLDEKIYKLESNCPGPRLATCTAWIEHLQMLYNSLAGIEVINTPKTSDNILNNIETNLVPPDVEILTFPPENNLNSAIIINNKSKNPLNQYNQYTAKTFENSNGNIIQLKDDSSHLPGYINPNQTQDLLNVILINSKFECYNNYKFHNCIIVGVELTGHWGRTEISEA